MELHPGNFGSGAICPDDVSIFRKSISERRRAPLKRVQTALRAFIKYYGCAWARCATS